MFVFNLGVQESIYQGFGKNLTLVSMTSYFWELNKQFLSVKLQAILVGDLKLLLQNQLVGLN